jgi:hypothetical protein
MRLHHGRKLAEAHHERYRHMEMALLTFGLPLAVVGTAASWTAVRAYRTYCGVRTVTCPENRRPVVVRFDAAHAAITAVRGSVGLRLRSCSRWPGRQNCRRECLALIKGAPAAARNRSVPEASRARGSRARAGATPRASLRRLAS